MLCVDFGSTFTKAALVDTDRGTVLATASVPTTVGTDGYHMARRMLAGVTGDAATEHVLACSSAGGGLRLAVVGAEREVTARAGHGVGLPGAASCTSPRAG